LSFSSSCPCDGAFRALSRPRAAERHGSLPDQRSTLSDFPRSSHSGWLRPRGRCRSRGASADGFFEAYWRRPEAYLDENIRRGMSVWASVGPDVEQRAVDSLRDDLTSGRWGERNRDLVDRDAAELGARLLIA